MPGYSLLINLTLLTPSIFMLQVFDRALSTRSVETLVVMAVMAGLRRGGALAKELQPIVQTAPD